MIRATTVVRRPAVRPEKVADEITLDHHARHRRRFAFTADGGLSFLLDLDKATVLDDGDAVKLEDGRLVRIKAAAEDLVEVGAKRTSGAEPPSVMPGFGVAAVAMEVVGDLRAGRADRTAAGACGSW